MAERFGRESADDSAALAEFLEPDFNMGVSFAFAIGLVIANFLLYLVPLPAFVKAKFREWNLYLRWRQSSLSLPD